MKTKPWMIVAACGAVLAGCAGQTITQIMPDPSFDQEQVWADQCQSNIKQLSVGVMIYMTDYDDVYPAPGWDGVAAYISSSRITACPRHYVHGEQHFHYAMSDDLIGVYSTSIEDVHTTPLLFEVEQDIPFMVTDFANILTTPRHKDKIYWTSADSSAHFIGETP